MKKVILSLVLLFGLVGIANASNIYTSFIDQGIIFSPGKAYYPTVIYDGSQYLMLHDKDANYAVSSDGITWTAMGTVNGLTNPMHTVMLYDPNGFEGNYNYKIWYLDLGATIPHGAGSIRYAESDNGITWDNDQAVFGGNMISYGDDNVDAPARTWGPGTVIYSPDAINTGDNPLDYSYVMYYDGYNGNSDDTTWDLHEALFLAYSIDGINWNRYGTSPILKGPAGGWDATCVGYPTIMKIEDGSYIMWYSGGKACNEGIGFATSPDAINWTKDEDNPIFYKSDSTDPEGYRAERTYTPRVIDDGSGELKMYYSAKSNTGVYAVGLATLSMPDTTSPVITFVEPVSGTTHSGVINLRAECNEVCDYVNFWWRAEDQLFAWYRYHYVRDDGTVFEWGLNTLDAQLADGTNYLMEDGTYYLYAAGKDLAGNWARTSEIKVTIDNTAPVVTINSPTKGSLVSGIVDIYGMIVEDIELSHYNISIYLGDANFSDFSQRIEQETVYLSSGFENQLIYQWDTTKYGDGEYLIRLAARDKAGNRDLSGDAWLGGDDSEHVIKVFVGNTKAGILKYSGVSGKGLDKAPGLQKPFSPKSQAAENAGKK